MYFFFQREGKESRWDLAQSADRAKIVGEVKPAFSTILDLSGVPDDNDWSKVRYRGPLYFDFDADGDLGLACEQFKNFLGKLDIELNFDISQASMYASGSKGFHIEIPQECFMPKVPPTGTVWLPYIYREIAQSLMVDTLDLAVYTGKRGRQWRTPNVQRENGCYKVQLDLENALTISPELYLELIQTPREPIPVTPPSTNAEFAMLFDRSKDKVTTSMRGRKKRLEKANEVLDPWRKAGKTPPSIERLMAGTDIAEGAGFQSLAMQITIYAASVGMGLPELLDRTKGLCETHVSDSRRYGSSEKRRDELSRMWEYMTENSLYEFDPGPIVRLLKPGTNCTDLGVIDAIPLDGDNDNAQPTASDVVDGESPLPELDIHASVRCGVFMRPDGIFARMGDNVVSLCRAGFRNVESFHDPLKGNEFKGYEFELVVGKGKPTRTLLTADTFTSSAKMKQFFANYQVAYQGNDAQTSALLDIMSQKVSQSKGRVYIYPSEGFMIMNNPEVDTKEPVKVYLTQDTFISSLSDKDPNYFRLRYRPAQAVSTYKIDVHKSPDLGPEHESALRDLFAISKPSVVADLVGWFVAAHYRSVYLHLFKQFPLLQVYGEAGAGKTQTIKLLSHLHWNGDDNISVKSATACTNFAMDCHASSSTSAPFILDEYKPRELRSQRGKYEKLKDVLKMSYAGADIGERGTVNRGADNPLAIIKSRATAPIVFIGEAIEMETAIIERSVTVALSKSFQTNSRRMAFERLQANPEALSALGRLLLEVGFGINLEQMREEVVSIRDQIRASLPDLEDGRKAVGDRLIYNRAVTLHGLMIVRRALRRVFSDTFDAVITPLLDARIDYTAGDDIKTIQTHGMSEISKVLSRIALLSRENERPWGLLNGKDYIMGAGWMELLVERAFDKYLHYCVSTHTQPLFDSIDAFMNALSTYTPATDRVCAQSELREDDSSERVIRFDTVKLRSEGVHNFKN